MGKHEALFAMPSIASRPRAGGGTILHSTVPLGEVPRAVGDDLERWGRDAPERVFLAERDAGGGIRRVTYGDAVGLVRGVAEALLDLDLSAERPLVLLSDNAIDHALLQLAAMHAAIPAVPISPAYSLVSQDLAKLRFMLDVVRPGAIYASDGDAFRRALALDEAKRCAIVTSTNPPAGAHRFDELARTRPGERARRAFESIGPDTVAKILFTSGSTGAPKGVLNTQRMLSANQTQIAACWPFLAKKPPVVVDWLPWSHTFGGNHNFHMVLRHGGTLFVDGGKPAPGLIERTVENLRAVPSTIYFNVPRGFDVLLPYLERDEDLRATFFRDLDVVFYAAAALPQTLWERLEAVAKKAGRDVVLTSAWGSTETSPLVTSAHFRLERAGNLGVPAPGCELALAPVGDRFELRVRGPQVTAGYLRDEAATREAFDELGFLRMGDAGKLADPADPARGVVFDGRLSENFKLSTGSWVIVGELRVELVGACSPVVQDCVIAGHDRSAIGILVFPSAAGCASIVGEGLALGEMVKRPEIRSRLADALKKHAEAHPHVTKRVARAMFLVAPPSIDAGEITDKGYVNQRAVLANRKDLVERLFAEAPGEDVVVIDGR